MKLEEKIELLTAYAAENIPLKVIGNIYENEDLLYKEN